MKATLKDWRLWAAIGCLFVMWDPLFIRYIACGAAVQFVAQLIGKGSSARDPMLPKDQVE